ncbi:MAG: hypothetical protein AAB774_02600 [Patescibacteria group bacterium]
MTQAETKLKNLAAITGLDTKTATLCHDGLLRMARTRDPLHDDQHIYRILSNLERFLEKNKDLEINFSVLLLAICWHDSWKATRFPTKPSTLVIDQYWDGYGSARIFKQVANQAGLNPKITRAATYAIREHGRLKFLKTKILEAKILQDIDSLDEWSLDRFEPLKEKYLVKDPNPSLIRLAKFYFDNFMKKQTDKKFWFDWSKAEFNVRKQIYVKEVDTLLGKYGHLLN